MKYTKERKQIKRLLTAEIERLTLLIGDLEHTANPNPDTLADAKYSLSCAETALAYFETTRPKLSTYTFVTGNRVEVEAYTEAEAWQKVWDGEHDKGEGATILESIN